MEAATVCNGGDLHVAEGLGAHALEAALQAAQGVLDLAAEEQAATVCNGGCNRKQWGLQPYAMEAVTVSNGGCNRM